MSRRTQFDDGRRNGIKACITWLHARANAMNDPHAKAVLDAAATNMGWAMEGTKMAPHERSPSTTGERA